MSGAAAQNSSLSPDMLSEENLAHVRALSAIAEQGPRGFYEGPVAEKLVKAIRDAGGIMTTDDLKAYQAAPRTPVRGPSRSASPA